ncbi:hypothetical protein BT63DRAFT_436446 [Microthyrium microscopicum]|uniref:Uncharacterized protein n=1 Tax=Microthyrium microscopicum TaxID=703497 RepID=A0A6A6UVR9_9PEZI|nr:hypothetical protein BT63DRAFT_436446 [Microthyrium microscopicum]
MDKLKEADNAEAHELDISDISNIQASQADLDRVVQTIPDHDTLKELLKAVLPFEIFYRQDFDAKLRAATETLQEQLDSLQTENGGLKFNVKWLSEFLNSVPDKIKSSAEDKVKDVKIRNLQETVEQLEARLAKWEKSSYALNLDEDVDNKPEESLGELKRDKVDLSDKLDIETDDPNEKIA